jgi:hypothetical protein
MTKITKEEWYSPDMVFPYTDEYGFVWMDHSGWLVDKAEPCFICKTPTKRLDVGYQGHYCNSSQCEETIRKDLERANDES